MLLYIASSVIILFAMSQFLYAMFDANIRAKVTVEVEEQGQFVMEEITRTIRGSEAITAPVAGASAASITIDTVDAGIDPTVYDLVSGVIRVTESAGSPIDLTSNLVTASSLTFTNATAGDGPGSVKVEFTLTHVNAGGRAEFDYSQTFVGTASLR